jgi:ribA/ribD-fused uncharacterized protein
MNGTFILYFGPQSVFSHWYKSEFSIDKRKFCCVEQYIMYNKAMLFGDNETANKILRSTNPVRHRYLGRRVKGFDKATWRGYCLRFAVEANLAKFEQDDNLKKILLKTGTWHFAEASPYDRNWGIGLSLSNQKIHDQRNWRGKNLCGIALDKAKIIIFSNHVQIQSPMTT